jgi:hypothetical protein
MKRNWIGLSALDVCYDAPDAGGGGGFDPGGDNGDLGGGDPAPAAAPAEPTVYDVSDDSLIRVKGQDKPVKYGEHFRGFQAQATKASQEAARLRQELAQYQQREQQLAAQRQAEARQRASQGQTSTLDRLKELPYLDGATAAQTISEIHREFQQRDQILVAAVQELQRMKQVVSQLNEAHTGQSFEGKISKWVSDLGLPAEAAQTAKLFYLAHEGADLDDQFPEMFREYWENQQKLFQAQQAAKVAANRKQPFLPGRGGAAGPSRPLQLDPAAKSSTIADQLWDMVQAESGT